MTGLWAQPTARVQHEQGGGASQSQAPRIAGLSWGGVQWKDPGWRNHPAACSALAACCHPAHIVHAFRSSSWRPPAEKDRQNPQMAFGKKGGGGKRVNVVMGGRGLGMRVGGEDGLALGKQVTTVIGSCSHNGRPVVLGPGTGQYLWRSDDSGWCSST